MKENIIEASIRRHGEKDSQGRLSEGGIRHAREVAREIGAELKNAPDGTIFFVMPSTVGRARATRDAMESALQESLCNEPDIQVLSVQGRPDWSKLERKKYIVTDFQPSSSIGYRNNERENAANGYWDSITGTLEGDALAAFKLWCAQPEEIAVVKAEMKAAHPNVPAEVIDGFDPNNFDFTPEEYAQKSFMWLQRMQAIAKQHVPDRPVRFLGISHDDISDFLTLRLLGHPLSSKTLEEHRPLRDFLEESTYTFSSRGLEISYRSERKTLTPQEIRDFPSRLREEIETRRKAWERGISP